MKSKKHKIIYYSFAIIFILFLSITCTIQCIPVAFSEEKNNIVENSYCDIVNGTDGTCYNETNITRTVDSNNLCNEHSTSHGPGRENGGTNILMNGCRNYMSINFRYGIRNIPYWINMNSMNLIANVTHRATVIADIRHQVSLWNTAIMHDGTGQVVNFYEVSPGTLTKPDKINGMKVIEILQDDLTSSNWAGVFKSSDYSVTLCYNHTSGVIGYNPDTIMHEFGHVLGLCDIDPANKVAYGTHQTLMSYNRTFTTIERAIKYQDIQGVASFNNAHTQHDYKRYVFNGSRYLHICFYCDRIDEQASAKVESNPIIEETTCIHEYNQFISLGETHWFKCTKCYKVIESEFAVSVSPDTREIKLLHFLNTTKSNVTIPSQLGGLPVTLIGANAFEYCTNLVSVSGLNNIASIEGQAFKGCSSLTNVFIFANTTNIGDGAFSGCNNLNISIVSGNTHYYANGNIVYTADGTHIVTAGRVSSDITIPSIVNEIGDYAFYNNSNVETISFGSVNPEIGDYAFAGCSNLSEAYFYDYIVPEVGTYSFPSNNFTAYVPHSKQLDYATTLDRFGITFDSLPITVTFDDRGDIVSTYNVHYGETINILPSMFRTGYTFAGWFENDDFSGEEYQLNDLWNSVTDITVYGKWIANEYTISFSGYGSDNLENVTVTYDSVIGQLPVVEKIGYTFYGWKDQYGEYYTANKLWQKTNNVTITPDLRANQYTITFNANGGQSNITSQLVTYDSVVGSLATASKTGHAFLGWSTAVDGNGQNYTAPFTYEIANDITLYAQYSPEEYIITFNKCNGVGGTDGVDAVFGYPMPEGGDITAPTRVGYTFDGYYQSEIDNSARYYDSNMHSTRNWDIARTATLYAHWIPNQYEVTLDNQINPRFGQEITSNSANDIIDITFIPIESGTITIWTTHTIGDPYLYLYNSNRVRLSENDDGNGNRDSKIVYSVTAGTEYIVGFRAYSSTTVGNVYCSGVALAPETDCVVNATFGMGLPVPEIVMSRAGYTFQGFFSQPNGVGTKYYNSELTAVNEWTVPNDATIYAYWIPNSYTISFDKKEGSGGEQTINVTYLSTLPCGLSAPSKNGYTFGGYYTEENGAGIRYYNNNMSPERKWDISNDTTLFANWIANTYTVTLNSDGNGGTTSVTVTFGSPMPTNSNIIAPQKIGHTFVGYYTGQNGTGKKYYEGPNMSSCADWDTANNATLYAYFAPNTYTVTLTSNGDFTNEYSITVTYGQPLPEVNRFAPKKSGYAFDGYYSSNGIRYYKMDLLNDQQTANINMTDEAFMECVVPVDDLLWNITADTVLTGRWSSVPFECDSSYWCFYDTEYIGGATAHFVHGNTTISPASFNGYEFDHFEYLGGSYSAGQSIPVKIYRGTSVQKDQYGNYLRDSDGNLISNFHLQEMVYAYYKKSCVTRGTLITLASGQQVPVELLTGNEMLLVWNMYTGQFDTAPILFIDSDPLRQYKVINLSFSDGTIVKVVSEHAFWDYTLNKYIYLREDAAEYIGHYFNKHGFDSDGNLTSYSVQLIGVNITQENTTVYSPVTYSHLGLLVAMP